MDIPVALRNQIKKDVTVCIVEEGEDPKTCIVQVARMHGLTKEQAEDIPFLMDVEEDEE